MAASPVPPDFRGRGVRLHGRCVHQTQRNYPGIVFSVRGERFCFLEKPDFTSGRFFN
jgi:hypothetical protein